MKLMTGNSNKPLAAAIADYIEIPLTDASVRRFADEEVFVEIHENVRGEDVFVIQSTAYPTNDNLMELLIMMWMARGARIQNCGLRLMERQRAAWGSTCAGPVPVT